MKSNNRIICINVAAIIQLLDCSLWFYHKVGSVFWTDKIIRKTVLPKFYYLYSNKWFHDLNSTSLKNDQGGKMWQFLFTVSEMIHLFMNDISRKTLAF